MSFKNDVDDIFKIATGIRKWYEPLGMSVAQAAVAKNYFKTDRLSLKAKIVIIEELKACRFLISGEDYLYNPSETFQENTNRLFSQVASKRLWYTELDINRVRAAVFKHGFAKNEMGLDMQIELLAKLGYKFEAIKTMPK